MRLSRRGLNAAHSFETPTLLRSHLRKSDSRASAKKCVFEKLGFYLGKRLNIIIIMDFQAQLKMYARALRSR